MNNKQLIRVSPEGEVKLIKNKYESIRDGVGGTFDFARSSGQVGAYVGDMSLFDGQPFNVVASMIVGYPIWGPAVITKGDTDNKGETLPPSQGVVDAAMGMAAVWQVVRTIAGESQGQQLDWYPRTDAVPPPTFIPMDDDQMTRWLETGEMPDVKKEEL